MTPGVQTLKPLHPYQVDADKLNYLKRVQSDRMLFTVKSIYLSATDIFLPVDHERIRGEQSAKYGPYTDYTIDDDAPIPGNETATFMSYYAV